ncbi:hypothetical protein L596_006381 [Steinernema carpocapsae]|uniref:G-protein coupled receptors family 1 profile domain-containing protein n=2 Tax=Steinernema carpocapsae TaxID=34508 RepID=A0A4V6I8R9_STECR|nr:hypothetical protein L596_006381 [Steinernema carpocapsae]
MVGESVTLDSAAKYSFSFTRFVLLEREKRGRAAAVACLSAHCVLFFFHVLCLISDSSNVLRRRPLAPRDLMTLNSTPRETFVQRPTGDDDTQSNQHTHTLTYRKKQLKEYMLLELSAMTPLWVAIGFGMVNLIVVCGNVFVLYVIISQKSMHTTTNFIVLSLTLSDFLLGVLILPFSIYQEYASSWLLGPVWCEIWLTLDVWLSTASIYNLLAISFDRYMAVRQPLKYRFISSTKMTRITIALVWSISGLLAFPPLAYEALFTKKKSRIVTCTPMTSNDHYIIFSAMVSFVLPAILMIWLNVCILRTVSDSHRPPKSSKTTSLRSLAQKDPVYLRVHRRGDDNLRTQSCRKQANRFASANASLREAAPRSTRNSVTSLNSAPGERGTAVRAQVHQHPPQQQKYQQHLSPNNEVPSPTKSTCSLTPNREDSTKSKASLEPRMSGSNGRCNSLMGEPAQNTVWYPAMILAFIAGGKPDAPASERSLLHPMLNFNRISLRTELRVARTIAVVVGCFTICWLPFTIIYILQAYNTCPVVTCIPEWLFTLAFWLGYSNSAINPLLYSAFSRDFRSAFRRVLFPRSSFRSSQLR